MTVWVRTSTGTAGGALTRSCDGLDAAVKATAARPPRAKTVAVPAICAFVLMLTSGRCQGEDGARRRNLRFEPFPAVGRRCPLTVAHTNPQDRCRREGPRFTGASGRGATGI